MFYQYQTWENKMLLSHRVRILVLQHICRLYQVKIRIDTTTLWVITFIVSQELKHGRRSQGSIDLIKVFFCKIGFLSAKGGLIGISGISKHIILWEGWSEDTFYLLLGIYINMLNDEWFQFYQTGSIFKKWGFSYRKL